MSGVLKRPWRVVWGPGDSPFRVTPAESRPELGRGSPGCGSLILEAFLSCLMGNCGAEMGAAAEAP